MDVSWYMLCTCMLYIILHMWDMCSYSDSHLCNWARIGCINSFIVGVKNWESIRSCICYISDRYDRYIHVSMYIYIYHIKYKFLYTLHCCTWLWRSGSLARGKSLATILCEPEPWTAALTQKDEYVYLFIIFHKCHNMCLYPL